ncbi:MAG: HAD family phosphatase [Chloroflexi bacterium]|nr:HAD family phosphatase [Chloroflexota bacterium]
MLVDSGPYHLKAWQALTREQGRSLTEARFRASFGLRNREIIRGLFRPDMPDEEVARLSQRKEELFRRFVAGRIVPLPGAVPLVRSLLDAGCIQALVSSTTRENIDLVLGSLGIAPYFRATVAGEDVTQGKPHPEGFLKAAHLLEVAPHACLVIEDSPAGIQAALAASMRCLAVATTHSPERLSVANWVVATLKGLNAYELLGKD